MPTTARCPAARSAETDVRSSRSAGGTWSQVESCSRWRCRGPARRIRSCGRCAGPRRRRPSCPPLPRRGARRRVEAAGGVRGRGRGDPGGGGIVRSPADALRHARPIRAAPHPASEVRDWSPHATRAGASGRECSRPTSGCPLGLRRCQEVRGLHVRVAPVARLRRGLRAATRVLLFSRLFRAPRPAEPIEVANWGNGVSVSLVSGHDHGVPR